MIKSGEDENRASLVSRGNRGVVQELRVLRGYLLVNRPLEYPHRTFHLADKGSGIQLEMFSEPVSPGFRYAAPDQVMDLAGVPSGPGSQGRERTCPGGALRGQEIAGYPAAGRRATRIEPGRPDGVTRAHSIVALPSARKRAVSIPYWYMTFGTRMTASSGTGRLSSFSPPGPLENNRASP